MSDRNIITAADAVAAQEALGDVIGYVLIDPNTNAIDWDGVVHEERADAIKEAVKAVHIEDREDRPCCGYDVGYEIAELRKKPDINEAVLTAAQEAWDSRQEWLANG